MLGNVHELMLRLKWADIVCFVPVAPSSIFRELHIWSGGRTIRTDFFTGGAFGPVLLGIIEEE